MERHKLSYLMNTYNTMYQQKLKAISSELICSLCHEIPCISR
jgi:hypothetical protein